MEYEQLLNSAMGKVSKEECCDRFEVKKSNIVYEGSNKTIITNFSQIALCLRRNQNHLARFLYKNLASYGEISGERLILGRRISQDLIQKKIELYIDNYVLCPNCGKPDSELIEENYLCHIYCLACGVKTQLNKI